MHSCLPTPPPKSNLISGLAKGSTQYGPRDAESIAPEMKAAEEAEKGDKPEKKTEKAGSGPIGSS